MATHEPFPLDIARHLREVRHERRLSQAEFARRCGLSRPEFVYFEKGQRQPSIRKLLQIAAAVDLPLQRLLYGSDRPAQAIPDLAHELRNLGLIDLRVDGATVPGAFRRVEEVIARAAAGAEPPARIIEGLPAILSWNDWNGPLLRAFARECGKAVIYRVAWLADIVLALDRRGGFPGGCPSQKKLAAFVQAIRNPPAGVRDNLGHPATTPSNSPVWKRWHIDYAAQLETFHKRAAELVALARAENRALPGKR